MTTHSPEPWTHRGDTVYFPNLTGGFSLHRCPEPKANAARIAACVNACAGIGEFELEGMNIKRIKQLLVDSDIERIKAEQQRDELQKGNDELFRRFIKISQQHTNLLDALKVIRRGGITGAEMMEIAHKVFTMEGGV